MELPGSFGVERRLRSNHYWGLAIDVTGLTGDEDIASPSDEYQWLAANAGRYGSPTPTGAKPVRLGGTGTGAGGWSGGTCCHLAAWHWEFVGFLTLNTG